MSWVLDLSILLFERSEFLIATSPPQNLCVCSTNLGFSGGKKWCVCSTNLGFSMIPGTYYVLDTYVPGIRYVCTTFAVVLLIVQLYRYLFVR